MVRLPRCSTAFLVAATLLLTAVNAPSLPQAKQADLPLAYHDHPPTERIPNVLDPQLFKKDRNAFTVYTLAAKTRETLYQVPCYCPCGKNRGHRSLLDCFTSNHGAQCHLCQQEAIFCFLERHKKTPAQLRQALAQGAAWSIDVEKEAARASAQTQRK